MGRAIDMVGKKCGRLFVLRRVENSRDGKARWLCLCDCGNEIIVAGKDLRSGNTKSCGCYQKDIAHNRRFVDLTGKRFGRLTVLAKSERQRNKRILWVCRCDCGKVVEVAGRDLSCGDTKSCGCLKIEAASHRAKERVIHGGTDDRLFGVWTGMKRRCRPYGNPENTIHNYSDRGIKVCPEWEADYSAFRKWAYANGYDETAPKWKCTLDRIDPDGNYEPSNCRFVDMKVQQNNRRNNRIFELDGESHTLAQWCELYGKSHHLVSDRLLRGWNLRRALTEKVHEEKSHVRTNKN